MRRQLLAAPLLVVVLLGPGRARADDECTSDPDCVGYYGEGYRCGSGPLGTYCVPGECTSDEDCWSLGGEAYCQDYGAFESRCVLAGEIEEEYECISDEDCWSLGGEAYCQDYGAFESRCVLDDGHSSDSCWDCEEMRREPPRFNSCAAAAGQPASSPVFPLLLGMVALVAAGARRTTRRDQRPASLSVGSVSTSAQSSSRFSVRPGQPGTDSMRPVLAARA